jgi:ubiquinone/menaquinone biosynthesis C-methylase UbiE
MLMPTTSAAPSYKADEENRDLESELARLKAQLDLSWKQELRLLRWLGLQDGMAILEVGCGPGYVTEQLYTAFPHSSITALDNDNEMLARAADHLEKRQLPQPEWVQASVLETGLAADQFDFVIARYLFQHLSDPVVAARELWRLLRPGGTLAIIDIDASLWGLVTPAYPQLHQIFAKTNQLQRGGNKLIGRYLWRILQAAGFDEVNLDSFVYHSDEFGIEPFLPQLDPERLRRALFHKQITAEEYAIVVALHKKFIDAPERYLLMCGFIGSGKK